MSSLLDNWTLDRSPGIGKAIYSGGVGSAPDANVRRLVGVGGTGTTPVPFPVLPEPGSIIPPPSSSARAGFFGAFKHATGFDGQTFLSDWTAGTTSGLSYSLSAWVDVSVQALSPLTGVLDTLMINYSGMTYPLSAMYPGAGSSPFNALPVQIALGGDTGFNGTVGSPGHSAFGDPIIPGPALYGNNNAGSGTSVYTRALTYPNHTLGSDNWLHLMFAYRMKFAQSGSSKFITERALCVVNDSTLFDVTFTGGGGEFVDGFIDFSAVDATVAGIGSSTLSTSGGGLVAGVAEYLFWANKFVDWTLQSNRYKTHVSDGFAGSAFQTWAPCDVGPTGARPGFGTPMVYCSGGPSSFPLNRATGKMLTVNTGISGGLFAVDDPPS
jgi:hypothetical protein